MFITSGDPQQPLGTLDWVLRSHCDYEPDHSNCVCGAGPLEFLRLDVAIAMHCQALPRILMSFKCKFKKMEGN